MNKKTMFRGAGCNSHSLLDAINNSINSPSKDTVPAGATWPFVTLSFDDNSVIFNMAHIHKTVTPQTTESIYLSKMGYFFFRTYDHKNEFGFATLKTRVLLNELQKQGYKLDASCQKNLFVAKAFLVSTMVLSAAVIITVIVMSILRPK